MFRFLWLFVLLCYGSAPCPAIAELHVAAGDCRTRSSLSAQTARAIHLLKSHNYSDILRGLDYARKHSDIRLTVAVFDAASNLTLKQREQLVFPDLPLMPGAARIAVVRLRHRDPSARELAAHVLWCRP